MALLFSGALLYHLWVVRGTVETTHELSALGTRLSLTSAEQVRLLDRMREAAGKYWVVRDSGYARQFRTTVTASPPP